MLPMRDGVRLATDIYRPARDGALVEGQFPTILCRTSYDKSAQRYVDIADFFTPRGYVVALQDLRGRGEAAAARARASPCSLPSGAQGASC